MHIRTCIYREDRTCICIYAHVYTERTEHHTCTGDGTYEVGDDVEVHSRQKRPEYNGKGGKLVAFDAQAGRWEVRLQGGSSLRVYMCVCM